MDLKIRDVAELLNVSESTIRRWITEGKIPAYKLESQYRFNRSEVENWVMSCRLRGSDGTLLEQKEKQIFPKEEDDKVQGVKQFGLFRAIHHGDVIVNAEGKEKELIIRNTVNAVSDKLALDSDMLCQLLLEREAMMPTSLGEGVAVPHTRDFLIKGPTDIVVIVFPKKPISWGGLDGLDAHTLFFLFASSDKSHLHLLAKIAHLASDKKMIAALKKKPNKDVCLNLIKTWEGS